jgi:hypothetical protein
MAFSFRATSILAPKGGKSQAPPAGGSAGKAAA